MAAAQRNAHLLLLLRVIRSTSDVQQSQLRALCQLLPSCTDHGYPHHQQPRYYSAPSNGPAFLPFDVRHQQPTLFSSGINHDAYRRVQPHSTYGQAAGFAASAACQKSQTEGSENKPGQPKTAGQSAQAFHDAGWTRREVLNLPNALSMARLLSGPVVAHLILQHQWPAALVTLTIAGISDWADGYAAKHWGQSSVLGSYLDPLADKVLIGCTVGALAAEGSLPVALAGIIIGRDVLLVVGACVDRCRKIGWRRVGWAEFFRTAPSLPSAAGAALDADNAERPKDHTAELRSGSSEQQVAGLAPPEGSDRAESEGSDSMAAGASISSKPAGDNAVPPAEFVQPLLISKLNTVLQLGLIAGCISHSWYDWPTESALWGLAGVTAGATLASFAAYVQVYRLGQTRSKS